MEFITILKINHTFNIKCKVEKYYCQWDGNEDEFERLFGTIDITKGATKWQGDVCTFDYCRTLIPEAAVDAHMKLAYSSNSLMVYKNKGVFIGPLYMKLKTVMEDDDDSDDEYELVTDPNECAEKLHNYFKDTMLWYYFKP